MTISAQGTAAEPIAVPYSEKQKRQSTTSEA